MLKFALLLGLNASSVILNDGVWHHIALVVDRKDTYAATAYIDGKQDISLYMGKFESKLDNSRFLAIGYDWCNRFKGTDEVRIYKRALEIEEVKADFQGIYRETVF